MHDFIKKNLLITMIVLISGCSQNHNLDYSYPKSKEQLEDERVGKLSGDGINIVGGKLKRSPGSNGIGVNSYLWRATLDVVYKLPLITVDPFGGTILTDWQQVPGIPNERYKLNIAIISSELRSDGLRVHAFTEQKQGSKWVKIKTNPSFSQAIEEKILYKAREIRSKQ